MRGGGMANGHGLMLGAAHGERAWVPRRRGGDFVQMSARFPGARVFAPRCRYTVGWEEPGATRRAAMWRTCERVPYPR